MNRSGNNHILWKSDKGGAKAALPSNLKLWAGLKNQLIDLHACITGAGLALVNGTKPGTGGGIAQV